MRSFLSGRFNYCIYKEKKQMKFIITSENAGKTIKEFLLRDMAFSGGLLKSLKARENGITVNGEHRTVRYTLCEGDVLVLADEDREEDTSPYITPSDIPIGIAYEDDHVTVADKPYAMPAHPSFSHRDDTVANALAHRYSSAPYVFRPVNRLDGDTSGLMITANNRLAAVKLGRAMIAGTIGKMYIAILKNAPPEEYGVIDRHMKRAADSIITRRIAEECEGGARRAITVYKKVYTDEKTGECAVIATPVTGRTHQLRVHFTSLGCPLIGDSLYDIADGRICRHALHAAYTSFPHPADGRTVHVYSPIPKDMRGLLGEEVSLLCERALREEENGKLRRMYEEIKKTVK